MYFINKLFIAEGKTVHMVIWQKVVVFHKETSSKFTSNTQIYMLCPVLKISRYTLKDVCIHSRYKTKIAEVTTEFKAIPQSAFQKCFKDWKHNGMSV